MTQVLIRSKSDESIAPLIKGAIEEQILTLKNGIDRTEEVLKEFEKKYEIKTEEFYKKFSDGEAGDNIDYIEWAGEYELFLKLLKDYEKLNGVEICT